MSRSLSSALPVFFVLLVGAAPRIVPPDDPAAVVARLGEDDITQGEVDAVAQEDLEELWAKRLQAEAEYRRGLQKARSEALKKVVEEKRRLSVATAGSDGQPTLEPVHLAQRYEVSASAAPSLGNDNAPVTLVELVDFECPFSAQLAPTLKAVLARYGDRVRLVLVSFPLATVEEGSFRAAEVAFCSGEQGQFWQAHDSFLSQQGRLRQEGAEELSRELALDRPKLRECLTSGRARLEIRRNQDAAIDAGLLGTPFTFVNGLFVPGNAPEKKLAQLIDSELLRLGLSPPSVAK